MTKYKKRKRSTLPVVMISLVVVAALAVGGFFGFKAFIKYTHPLKYENYVEKYSRENGVDKYLVYAVIKTESNFDPNAVSDLGARGLMQIMEDTFDWLKYRMEDEETRYLDMYDARTNIRYGCWLLGYLYDEFGSVETTMAAYHAGRGKVNEWLQDSSLSADGVHLDVIPTSDTAHYVSKIVRAMDIYKKIYDN
ncbi:MAG: lytic transglycosylase domain-containing protein [Oscillospiraceae bacterium]